MNDFALDAPRVKDSVEQSETTYLLANQDISFRADLRGELYDFTWPWADAVYARSIQIRLSAPREDEFVPIATRIYPGYLESIIGDEGIIIAKQITAPLGSGYDRSALWLLECQAEGDRLLRVDVHIDWGYPVAQRMVDGLLVAQVNPGPTQGIYEQQNADSTRVFGNPEGRPESVNLDNTEEAHLTYFVLINGEVEVQFLLTVSDVGEQVAWNGFLALRDGAKVAEKSGNLWIDYLRTGRLWTPDPDLNRLLNLSKIAAVRSLQRLRTGMTPAGRKVEKAPALVDAWDLFDPIQSRNVLAHLRRLAEKSQGHIPQYFPLRRKDALDTPGRLVTVTNSSYLSALLRHLTHHFDLDLLAEHYTAIGLCAEVLARQEDLLRSEGLRVAASLATLQGDTSNARRWHNLSGKVEEPDLRILCLEQVDSVLELGQFSGWYLDAEGEWCCTDPLNGAALVGAVLWGFIGISSQNGSLRVNPRWPADWNWWALMDLSCKGDQRISLVWDGENLHTTLAVTTDLPVIYHRDIKTINTDEDHFALEFLFEDEAEGGTQSTCSFKPELD